MTTTGKGEKSNNSVQLVSPLSLRSVEGIIYSVDEVVDVNVAPLTVRDTKTEG